MGRFAGLAGVRTNMRGRYYVPGNFRVRINQVQFKKTRKGDHFIVNTETLESNVPEIQPGAKVDWVLPIKAEFLSTCLGDVKAFAAALMGIENPDEYKAEIMDVDRLDLRPGEDAQTRATDRFWEQCLEEITSESQPARGTVIHLYCFHKPTRSGGVFTQHVWGPVVEDATDDNVSF